MFPKNKRFAGRLITFLVVGLIFAMFAPSAFATNGHQDHQGACARSTSSIKKGVSDLQYNGVLNSFAKSVGIHGFDGSLKKQMEEQLIIGTIAVSVTTENTGCNGAGGTFSAGLRTLYKGEKVALKVPAKIGKEACKGPSPKCKKVRVVVTVVFPVSCWNKNHKKRIVVWIWVHKPTPKHHPPKKKCKCKKKPKQCSVKAGHANGNCLKQTNTATVEQECKGQVSGNQCIVDITQINIVCGNATIENTGNVNQGGNCNTGGEETCVGQNNCNQQPPPPCGCKPPEESKIMITSKTDLNMIPAGKNSGPFKISVEASKAGGTLTVDPGIGAVSSCDSTIPQEKAVFSNLAKGASELCVIIYAPENDADKPEWMTVTLTAVLDSASDKKEQTFKITYPTRPPQ